MPTTDQQTAREEHASVLLQVADVMIALYQRQFGSVPTAARTYWVGPDAMSCVLENTLTPAERTLVKQGRHPNVRDGRTLTQHATAADVCAPVERLTGRTVRSLQSSIDTHADGLSVETFLFHPEGHEGLSRAHDDTRTLGEVVQDTGPTAPSIEIPDETDDMTAAERSSATLAGRLLDTGNLGPLIEEIREAAVGSGSARDALTVLVELDPHQLVQFALDTFTSQARGTQHEDAPRVD